MSGKSTLNIYSTNFWAYEPEEAVRVVLFCSLINQRVQPFSYQSEGATFLLSIRGCNLSLINQRVQPFSYLILVFEVSFFRCCQIKLFVYVYSAQCLDCI